MSKPEQIGDLISLCLEHCRASGYTLATLVRCLDDMRKNGHSEVHIQTVDGIMRQMLMHICENGDETTKVVGI